MPESLHVRHGADASQTETARAFAETQVVADNRSEAVAQRKLAEMMNNSARVSQQRALSNAVHNSTRMVAQRREMSELFGGAVKPHGAGAMPAEASPAQREEKTKNAGLPDHMRSGIEGHSGMTMDQIKAHHNSGKPAQLRAHAYSPVIQRMEIRAPEGLPLDDQVRGKLTEVTKVLAKVVAPDGNGEVIIEIINERGLSPANTVAEGDNIRLRLNRWYIEKASVGEAIGMLIHELGVHSLTDRRMNEHEQEAEPRRWPQLRMEGMTDLQTGSRTPHSLEKFDQSRTHNLEGHTIGPYADADPRRQKDHVNLAKSLAGGDSTRGNVYQSVFLSAGDAIFKNSRVSKAERNARLIDLAQSYLFDLARVVVTDDGGPLSMANKTSAIADMMNFFRERLSVRRNTHRWLSDEFFDMVETSGSVRMYLLNKLEQLLHSSHPRLSGVPKPVTAAIGKGLKIVKNIGRRLGAL